VRKLVYSMMVSLDGFVEDSNRSLDWVKIDEEIHVFSNDEARETGVFLYGRGLYDVMAAYWPTADADPSTPGYMVEFAQIWKEKPKVVFSKTLDTVDWNSRLVRGEVAEEITRLKREPGDDLSVGGARLAWTCIQLGLVDEYRLLIHPVLIGSGTPFFPPLEEPMSLRMVETRTFRSGVVYVRYVPA